MYSGNTLVDTPICIGKYAVAIFPNEFDFGYSIVMNNFLFLSNSWIQNKSYLLRLFQVYVCYQIGLNTQSLNTILPIALYVVNDCLIMAWFSLWLKTRSFGSKIQHFFSPFVWSCTVVSNLSLFVLETLTTRHVNRNTKERHNIMNNFVKKQVAAAAAAAVPFSFN